MLYTELTKKAMCIACNAHAGQLDKQGFPYIRHPFHLAERADEDEELIAVALLHDVLEDSSLNAEYLLSEGIPSNIVDVVVCLTRRKEESYFEYIERIKENEIATKIKLLDLEHNMREGCPSSLYKRYAKAHRILESSINNHCINKTYRIPKYSEEEDAWCVETDKRLIYGSIAYVISEFCGDNCIYKYKLGDKEEHEHTFESVLAVLVENADIFSIDDYLDCYSNQEIRVLAKARDKILQKR